MLNESSIKILNNKVAREPYPTQEAISEIFKGISQWRFWSALAFNEIRKRYRRTKLGPFWTTLTLAIFMATTSILFSKLWKMDIATFIPFYASGFICWSFISSIITESCLVFVVAEGTLKYIVMPYSLLPCQLITRNIIVLLHHMIVYMFIIIIFQVPVNLNSLLFLPALILASLTSFWISMIIGIVCARYRDVQPLINSVLQICLFLTPIFWHPSNLQGLTAKLLLNFNPFYHFISLLRMPMLGQSPDNFNWLVAIAITFVGWFLMIIFFSKTYRKLIFWL